MNETPPTPDRHLSRRRFVQGSAMAGFAVFLAACGRAGTSAAPSTAAATEPPSAAPSVAESAAPTASAVPTPKPSMATTLNWANWTYYMDVDPKDAKKFKTLEDFKAKYGTTVKYQEVIDDNDAFVGTIKPQLQSGKDTGWDLIVLTDWMAARLIRLKWVEQMDLGNLPNVVANLQDVYKNVTWDPTNDHHVPVAVGHDRPWLRPGEDRRPDQPRRAVRPQVQGQGRLPDRDARHDRPDDAQARPRSVEGHQGRLRRGDRRDQEGRDAGIVRAFKGNEYAQDLNLGNIVLSMAWSGDMVQALSGQEDPALHDRGPGRHALDRQLPDPERGQERVHGAGHDRLLLRPGDRGADRGLRQLHLPGQGCGRGAPGRRTRTVANNPLIFPPADILAKLHIFNGLDEATEKYFNDQFATVSQA